MRTVYTPNKYFNIIALSLLLLCLNACQSESQYQTWKVYKGDAGSSSYSSLDQINKKNVDQLKIAWTYKTNDIKAKRYSIIETNPIIVDDVMYAASPLLKVFALDAQTGKELWHFDPFKNSRANGYLRAVSYWEDGNGNDKRILFSAGTNLYALHAKTGTLVKEFGKQGIVDLNKGLGRDPDKILVKDPSPGIVYKNLLILGSAVGEAYNSAPGHIRAYNIKTGELCWTFHTIPQSGEPGADTWAGGDPDSAKKRGGVNNWAGMCLDKKQGIVYIPLGSPAYDFYGGERKGKNLYANSIVALDAATGKYIWHYQTVHHDLWDYDLPAPPNLVTIKRNGKDIQAVAQVSKTGFTYVLDRKTGEPVYPVKEKKVPASAIKNEEAWPTQPFPVKPEPFTRQGFTKDMIANISPEAHDSIEAKFKTLRHQGLFTPPDPSGTIVFPSTRGGANWGGAAYDPQSNILYINANETPEISTVKKITTQITQDESLIGKGRTFYIQHCSSCHGADRKGQPPTYPSLTRISKSHSKKEVLNIIHEGGGRMPAFTNITKEEKNAIIAFLFNKKNNDRKNYELPIHKKADLNKENGKYINVTAYSKFKGPDGYPAIKPPWGTLNAINLNTGKIKWKIPLGTYPKLKSKNTGMESWGGPIVTAGDLVFIGGTADKKFRAFDKDTGKLLWQTTLPTGAFATPATYMSGSKQYVVIAVGGGRGTRSGDYYIAFTLPD